MHVQGRGELVEQGTHEELISRGGSKPRRRLRTYPEVFRKACAVAGAGATGHRAALGAGLPVTQFPSLTRV